ncbi:NUDIX hydrolase [Virgibacillus kekensis]|uniref:NUDIX hydrolase n=1 Tax=Virgibacillus kekensis TaxID=202261 RepID=A0ABV9DLZ4_9BACI
MEKWYGAAGVCIDDRKRLLMVKQGLPEEKKLWSIPSGGIEKGESPEECCIREIKEETGYEAEIAKSLYVKEGSTFGVQVEVHYFLLEILGGFANIQDPDNLIYEIGWKTVEELQELELSFPEDREVLLDYIQKYGRKEIKK